MFILCINLYKSPFIHKPACLVYIYIYYIYEYECANTKNELYYLI